MRQRSTSYTRALGLALAAAAVIVGSACNTAGPQAGQRPHVDHITLPPHKTWRVVSVVPYEGLEDVELVRVDWPTAQEPTYAFALTREGLDNGHAVCLDHVAEIDTLWAHPVPDGGCEKLGTK